MSKEPNRREFEIPRLDWQVMGVMAFVAGFWLIAAWAVFG
jgi:hypothetical protein